MKTRVSLNILWVIVVSNSIQITTVFIIYTQDFEDDVDQGIVLISELSKEWQWDFPPKKIIAKRQHHFLIKATNLMKMLKNLLAYIKILKSDNYRIYITYTSAA